MAFAVFSSSLDSHLAPLALPAQTRQALGSQRSRLAGIEAPPNVSPQQGAQIKRAVGEAFVDSFRVNMFISAGLAVASAGCALLFVEGKKRGGEPGM